MIRWLSNYIFISHRNSIITTSDQHTAERVKRFFLPILDKMSDCETQTLTLNSNGHLIETRRSSSLPSPGVRSLICQTIGLPAQRNLKSLWREAAGADADNLSVLFLYIKTTALAGESPITRFGDVHLGLVCTCQRHQLSPEKRRMWHKWQVQYWKKMGRGGGGAYIFATSRHSNVLPIQNMTISADGPQLGEVTCTWGNFN